MCLRSLVIEQVRFIGWLDLLHSVRDVLILHLNLLTLINWLFDPTTLILSH